MRWPQAKRESKSSQSRENRLASIKTPMVGTTCIWRLSDSGSQIASSAMTTAAAMI